MGRVRQGGDGASVRESCPVVAMSQIREVARRIGREFRAHKVVLFGSYARGLATEDSDVDLLVILPFEGKSVEQSVAMRLTIRPAFPVDLIVRTPEKVQERLRMGDGFLRQVLQQGKVLYEADGG